MSGRVKGLDLSLRGVPRTVTWGPQPRCPWNVGYFLDSTVGRPTACHSDQKCRTALAKPVSCVTMNCKQALLCQNPEACLSACCHCLAIIRGEDECARVCPSVARTVMW